MLKSARSRVALFSILTILTLLLPASTIRVHAQSTGLVCIAETSGPTCPSFQPTIGPAFPGGNAVVNVVNSQAFNGFDVSVKADPTILNATGIDLSANAFQLAGGTLFVAAECINGHPVVGNCRSQDGPGIVSVAVTSNVLVTAGHLYNISYHPLGSGTTSVNYQSGCSGTSNDSACVTLVNASVTDPESLQGATFTTGDFSIATTPTSQTITAGSSTSFTVTITSMNGFTGMVSLTDSISPSVAQGPAASLNPTIVNLPTSGSQATSTLTVTTTSSTPTGTYTIFASGASCSACSLSHTAARVTLNVNPQQPPDFSIVANPSSQSVTRGSSATFTATLTSLGGFTGTVNLSATVSPTVRKGPAVSLSPTSVSLVSGGSGTSILTISTNRSTPPGTYSITVTGTGGSITHSATVTLIITK